MAGLKKTDLFEGYVQVGEIDQKKLSDLVVMAKGDRTLQDFAAECGLNISTLSRIINRKNAGASADSVIARIAIHADPQSGVTINDLLEAQGRKAVGGAKDPKELLARIALDDLLSEPAKSDMGDAETRAQTKRDAYTNALKSQLDEKKRKDMYRLTLQNELLLGEHTVALSRDDVAIRGSEFDCYADFILETDALESEGLKSWAFLLLKETGNAACFGMTHYFGMMFLMNPVADGKRVTFITEDKVTYQLLRNMYGSVAIPASVSFMLVDVKALKVKNEFVMGRSDGIGSVKNFGEGAPIDWEEICGVPSEEE